jgi:hypothetical protein
VKGANATTEDAYAYARTFKMYYLDDPKPTQFIDPTDIRYSTLPFYDERYSRIYTPSSASRTPIPATR